MIQDIDRALDRKRVDLRRMEEDFLRSKKDMERQASKSKAAATGSSKEDELQDEIDGLWVRISSYPPKC
jgi:hypothetical protein